MTSAVGLGAEDVNDTIDDDAYGRALLEELKLLTQDLAMARKERDQSRMLNHSTEAELASLKNQLQQRKERNNLQFETDLLKKKVDASKREKALLLKRLAALQRECIRLQRAAGLELSESKGALDGEDCQDETDARALDNQLDDDENHQAPLSHSLQGQATNTRVSRQKRSSRTAPTSDDGQPTGTSSASRSRSVSYRRSRTLSRQLSYSSGSTDGTPSAKSDLIAASKPRRKPIPIAQRQHSQSSYSAHDISGPKFTSDAAGDCRKSSRRSHSSDGPLMSTVVPRSRPTAPSRSVSQDSPRSGPKSSLAQTIVVSNGLIVEDSITAADSEKSSLNKYPRSPIPDKKDFGLKGTIHVRKSFFVSLEDFSDDCGDKT